MTQASTSARFLDLALRTQVLQFGDFTLKSGRSSPYFFNLGKIHSGAGLAELASCYADALEASGIAFDGLFGPAYKGIPLVAAVACELSRRGRDLPFSYNRKEAKDHGEGGLLVGMPEGRIVILDDVLTAGTALRQAIAQIREAGAQPVAALLAFDRQERGQGQQSTAQELATEQQLQVLSIAGLADLSSWLQDPQHAAAIESYREQWGVS
nr:orotate phosphoribosyltransferase [Oceanococcus sp. HetDA_MAG_MS8]